MFWNKCFVLIWNGQKCHRKLVLDIQKKSQKYKLWYWSEMVRSDFWTSKMATGGHLKKKHLQKSWASDLNNVQTDCWPNTTWYKFTFGQYKYRQVCWERGNIHCVRPLGRMHTILVSSCGRPIQVHVSSFGCSRQTSGINWVHKQEKWVCYTAVSTSECMLTCSFNKSEQKETVLRLSALISGAAD